MLVMRATEGQAYPLGQLVVAEQPVRLRHPSLAECPLSLFRGQLRALLQQVAA
jgi:hypothetical protein